MTDPRIVGLLAANYPNRDARRNATLEDAAAAGFNLALHLVRERNRPNRYVCPARRKRRLSFVNFEGQEIQ